MGEEEVPEGWVRYYDDLRDKWFWLVPAVVLAPAVPAPAVPETAVVLAVEGVGDADEPGPEPADANAAVQAAVVAKNVPRDFAYNTFSRAVQLVVDFGQGGLYSLATLGGSPSWPPTSRW